MWFKGLLSVAAIAVIAGVSAYFWDRHQAEVRAEQAECDARLADWKRIRNGMASERGNTPASALIYATSCQYKPTAEDRKAAGLE